jgi:HMG (high mobility group) box
MSAFLKYSQTRRAKFKEENPDMGNTDVSRLLGETWRNASAAERAPYVEEELRERAAYKEQIKKFRETLAKEDAASRTSHHAVPQQFGDYNTPTPPPPPPTQQHQQMYDNFGDMTVFEPLQVQSVEDAVNKADQRVSGYRPIPMENTRRYDHHQYRPYSEKEANKKDQRMFRPAMEIMPTEEGMRQQGAYRGYSPAAYHQAYHPPYHAGNVDRGRDHDYRDHPNIANRHHPPSRVDDGTSRYAASAYFADNNTHPSFGFYHYP